MRLKLPSIRLPRIGASGLVSQWLIATIALSIIAHLDGGFVVSRFALIPSRVWLWEIWRLVTWPFIELGPISLIFTCVALYKFGNDVAARWGERRLQRYALHIILGAAALTVLFATLTGHSRSAWTGGWGVMNAVVIAWARQFPSQPLVVYGLLTLSGRRLIRLVVATTVLFTIVAGPLAMAPDLAACLLAVYYPQRWLRR